MTNKPKLTKKTINITTYFSAAFTLNNKKISNKYNINYLKEYYCINLRGENDENDLNIKIKL